MDPSVAIEVLLAELRRLRAEGVESVRLGLEAEAGLRELIAGAKGVPVAGASPATRTPVGRAEAGVADLRQAQPTPSPPRPPAQRPVAPPRSESIPPPPVVDVPAGASSEANWQVLRERLESCEVARQRRPAGTPAFVGHGSAQPDVLFVTEHPEEPEERGDGPFAGPPGELLGKAVRAMGLGLDRVQVVPLLRWRPLLPSRLGSRPPTADEIAYCLPFLRAQVAILAPRVVVALGNVPLNALAGGPVPLRITQARGAWREAQGIPLMPTYLPSYLLRNPSAKVKREFWEDLLSVMERLGLPISERQRGFYLPPASAGAGGEAGEGEG